MHRLVFVFICLGFMAACHTTTPSDAATGRNPKAAEMNMRLGLQYLHTGSIQRAKTKLLRAMKQAPTDPAVNDAYAYFLEMTGELAQAETLYQQAILYAEHKGQVYNNYGAFLCRQERYQDAQKAFEGAFADRNYVKIAAAYENAGLCAAASGDIKQGLAYLHRAAQKDPRRPQVWLEQARLSYQIMDDKAAQRAFKFYESLALPSADGLQLAIGIERALGHTEKAASYQQRLAELQGSNLNE